MTTNCPDSAQTVPGVKRRRKISSGNDAADRGTTEKSVSGDNYFQDEADYYLALCYLAVNKTELAIPIIEKIKADTSHIYNKKAKGISAIDLKVLQYKHANN